MNAKIYCPDLSVAGHRRTGIKNGQYIDVKERDKEAKTFAKQIRLKNFNN